MENYENNTQLVELMSEYHLSARQVADIINKQADSNEVTVWAVYAWRKNYSGKRRMRTLYLSLLRDGLKGSLHPRQG
jgi:hypothetical protein